MPMPKNSSAMARVRPKPPAAFSPLAMTRSGFSAGLQARQIRRHHVAARLADNVAQEKNIHRKRLQALFGEDAVQRHIMRLRRKQAISCPA